MNEVLDALFVGMFGIHLTTVYALIAFALGIAIVVFLLQNRKYKKSAYYSITRLPYLSVRLNFGRYGEYLIYKNLVQYEKDGSKFLFNTYIPKKAKAEKNTFTTRFGKIALT